jgi:hypothetical protein
MTADCDPCAAAIAGERIALVLIDETEVGVLACRHHLERVALALELLEQGEKYQPSPTPPGGTNAMLARRVIVVPELTT